MDEAEDSRYGMQSRCDNEYSICSQALVTEQLGFEEIISLDLYHDSINDTELPLEDDIVDESEQFYLYFDNASETRFSDMGGNHNSDHELGQVKEGINRIEEVMQIQLL